MRLEWQGSAQAAAISAVERVLVRVRVGSGGFQIHIDQSPKPQLAYNSSQLSIRTRAIMQIGLCRHLAVSNPRSFPNPWLRIWAFNPNRSPQWSQ